MDFYNDFVQATLIEDVYLDLPYYFDYDTDEDTEKMFMKINKSVYGLVRTPLYWYNNLKGAFEEI